MGCITVFLQLTLNHHPECCAKKIPLPGSATTKTTTTFAMANWEKQKKDDRRFDQNREQQNREQQKKKKMKPVEKLKYRVRGSYDDNQDE